MGQVRLMPEEVDKTKSVQNTMPIPAEIERIFAAKKEWHQSQAQLPLKEKVAILLQMQRNSYPILKARGVLKSWQKPWDIEP
jgi:hypothetical protein